uniref:Ig-like domain-containing protein n=1 Tax=Poecilia formosa TaxID=48698 RepID=A0A096M8P6_POEFO
VIVGQYKNINITCKILKLCSSSLFVLQILSADPVKITVKSGQDANLTCRAAGNGKVSVVRLTRDNLKPNCVLLYRNDQIDEEQQNTQYLGRTKLHNFISTDGKVNLTLNSVTEEDNGVYECRVRTEIKSNTRRKRAALESTFINLRVGAAQSDPPGE